MSLNFHVRNSATGGANTPMMVAMKTPLTVNLTKGGIAGGTASTIRDLTGLPRRTVRQAREPIIDAGTVCAITTWTTTPGETIIQAGGRAIHGGTDTITISIMNTGEAGARRKNENSSAETRGGLGDSREKRSAANEGSPVGKIGRNARRHGASGEDIATTASGSSAQSMGRRHRPAADVSCC